MIDIDRKKQDVLDHLDIIEKDCKTILLKIPKFREDITKVKTYEDYYGYLQSLDDFNTELKIIDF